MMKPPRSSAQKVSSSKTSEQDRYKKLADITSTNHMVLKLKFDGLETKTMQRFDKVEGDIEVLKTDVSELKTEMNQRFDKVEGDVSELKTDVAVLKTDVSELKTGMSEQTDLLKMIAKNVKK